MISKKMMLWLDKLVEKSEDPKALFLLEKLFVTGIPFNKPHGISFIKLTQEQSCLKMRHKRLNLNHLKSMHACAICTLGEFCAGLLLCKNFPMTKYRVIMKGLQADYKRQSKENIYSSAKLSQENKNLIHKQLVTEGKAVIEFESHITNHNNELIAVVSTQWQLKDWSQTNF